MNESGFDSGFQSASGVLQMLGAFGWIFFVAMYAYFGYTMYKIAQKCGCNNNAWWAWVPVLSLFLMIQCAKKEWWYAILCLIPLVNIVVIAMIWIAIAKQTGNSPFWGIMALIPFINFVAVGVMAFKDNSSFGSSFHEKEAVREHTQNV